MLQVFFRLASELLVSTETNKSMYSFLAVLVTLVGCLVRGLHCRSRGVMDKAIICLLHFDRPGLETTPRSRSFHLFILVAV